MKWQQATPEEVDRLERLFHEADLVPWCNRKQLQRWIDSYRERGKPEFVFYVFEEDGNKTTFETLLNTHRVGYHDQPQEYRFTPEGIAEAERERQERKRRESEEQQKLEAMRHEHQRLLAIESQQRANKEQAYKAQQRAKARTRKRYHIRQAVKNEVWERDGGACVRCGSTKNLQFDHDIPHADWGSDDAKNIQLLCASCNLKKGRGI